MEATSITQANKDVFYKIQSIVASAEFLDSQLLFYKTNMHLFDEDDENKLEYTGIYEHYVMAMEQVIDAKLYESIAQDIVDAFYADFTQQYKEYEKLDAILVDTLFTMTDFLKFKEVMLRNKKALSSVVGGKDTESADEQMPDSTDFFKKCIAESVDDAANGWNKRLEWTTREGNLNSAIYSKKIDGYRIDWIRAESHFKDISYKVWRQNINDWEKMMNSNPMYKSVEIAKRHENGFPSLTKMSCNIGMLMTDRDFLIKSELIDVDDKSAMMLIASVKDDDHPETDSGNVRCAYYSCGLCSEAEDGGLKYSEIQYMDLKGYIPPAIVNMTIAQSNKGIVEMSYDYFKPLM